MSEIYTGPCSECGENIEPGQECECPGSPACTCEFSHHHKGCCEILNPDMDRPPKCSATHVFGS